MSSSERFTDSQKKLIAVTKILADPATDWESRVASAARFLTVAAEEMRGRVEWSLMQWDHKFRATLSVDALTKHENLSGSSEGGLERAGGHYARMLRLAVKDDPEPRGTTRRAFQGISTDSDSEADLLRSKVLESLA